MGAFLQLVDETPGGAQTAALSLRLPRDKVSIRELIRQRIEQEVAAFNEEPREIFHGLVQPTNTEPTLTGYRLRPPRPLDCEMQVRVALEAFESSCYFMLFGNRRLQSLDEEIVVEERSVVSFIRLLPLVGG